VVIDAGTGIRNLGDMLKTTGSPVEIHLLITHIHWDHILGFPFFAPIYDPQTRIRVDGIGTCAKGLRYTFDNRMGDGFFPIQFNQLEAKFEYLNVLQQGPLEIDGARVDRIALKHPQGGFGFRFQEGHRKLVFITDNELTGESWRGRDPEVYARFCDGADVLIHDAQYTPDEMGARKGWGHSDYASVFELGVAAGVGRLVLFHHDPGRRDGDVAAIQGICRAMAKERGIDMAVEAAREEAEFVLA
jgi:phosphoribosyl 1,2-cyclic phosphodiesterase